MSQTITLFHLLAALAALYLPFVCVTDYHFRIGGFCVFFFVVFEVSYLVVFGVWYQYLVAPDSHHPATVHPDNANIHSLQIHLLQLPSSYQAIRWNEWKNLICTHPSSRVFVFFGFHHHIREIMMLSAVTG